MNYEKVCDEVSNISDEVPEENIYILGVSRFNNINGITCYMNSILHILQQIPIFVKYIYDFEFEQILLEKNLEINECVIYELHRLFKISFNHEDSTISPKTFKDLIGTKNNMWNEYNHQDSQEFFNFLISQIKEEIGLKVKIIPNIKYNIPIADSIDNIIATKALSIYQSQEYSPLTDLFDGLYKNTCSCACCKSININFEPFLTLAVDVYDDLYECLDNVCLEQQLDIDNKYICDFCGLTNKAFKKTLLWKTPKILVIHIKRFGSGEQKITSNVDYPIKDLDLSKYIDPKSPFKINCYYDLIGVNIHHSLGYNINAGHYTSIVKNRLNNSWFLYNDSKTPEIQYYKKDLQSNDAYLLFYYRHN